MTKPLNSVLPLLKARESGEPEKVVPQFNLKAVEILPMDGLQLGKVPPYGLSRYQISVLHPKH